jgi:hypothetical protein
VETRQKRPALPKISEFYGISIYIWPGGLDLAPDRPYRDVTSVASSRP